MGVTAGVDGPLEHIPGAVTLIAEAGGGNGGVATRAPLDVEWNWNTGELYAAGHGGVLSVYKQR